MARDNGEVKEACIVGQQYKKPVGDVIVCVPKDAVIIDKQRAAWVEEKTAPRLGLNTAPHVSDKQALNI